MASVYSGAVCCITFVFPPEEEHVRSRPDPRVTTPCIIRHATETHGGLTFVPRLYGDTDEHATYKPPELSEMPWSKRAWTFQVGVYVRSACETHTNFVPTRRVF
jgi:hypothetical protein